MKLYRLGWLVSLCAIAWIGCDTAAEGEADAGAQQPAEEAQAAEGEAAGEQPAEGEVAEAAEAEAPGPDAACAKLLESIKAKDAAAVAAVSTDAAADAITGEVLAGLAASLGSAACGEASVDGDKAMVKVAAGENNRDVPFVKAADAWKFDFATYAEKYPVVEKKGKKGKRKKGKKRKGKRRK